jgi:hypothetical protein
VLLVGNARDKSVLVVVVDLPGVKIFLVHLLLDVRHVTVGVELVAGV